MSPSESSQTERIRSSESAERSQELDRLFDGCLSLHPSATTPMAIQPATPRVGSAAGSGSFAVGSGRPLSGSGNSSGSVAALVAAFSGNSPSFKHKVLFQAMAGWHVSFMPASTMSLNRGQLHLLYCFHTQSNWLTCAQDLICSLVSHPSRRSITKHKTCHARHYHSSFSSAGATT